MWELDVELFTYTVFKYCVLTVMLGNYTYKSAIYLTNRQIRHPI